jgi:proteasome lid subunit RPN8/RPN11
MSMMRDTRSVSNPLLVEGKARRRLCRWDAPDGACFVVLDSNLMEELRRQAIQAYLSLPKRGAEIGGLLFGDVRQDGSMVFQIDGCEGIPCEYRFGPSYKLSETDYGRLSERLARHQHDGSEPVIGWYRSYTGREAALDHTDLELLRNAFPRPHLVSLLLQPISAEKCMARFQFGSDGELAADRPYEPFLLEPAQLKVLEAQAEPEPPKAPPAAAGPGEQLWEPSVESPRPVPVLPARYDARTRQGPEDDAMRAPRGSRNWLPVLLCALAAIAGAAAYGFWTLERQPRWAPMGLDATASARELLVIWDSAAPVIEQASRGVMSVTDGSKQNQIPLTAAQLRGGKLSYLPSNADVLFRFLVYDAGNRASGDSLRVANLHLTEPTPAPRPVAAEPPATPPDDAVPGGTPAVARREVQPDVPSGIRARVRVRTVVAVQLHINASGQVTGADAKGAGHGLDRYLAGQAVKAARHWSFVPAHAKDGSAIASVKTVEFVFLPDGSGGESRQF